MFAISIGDREGGNKSRSINKTVVETVTQEHWRGNTIDAAQQACGAFSQPDNVALLWLIGEDGLPKYDKKYALRHFFTQLCGFFKINYFKNFILEKSNFKCTNLKVQITIFIINVN